MLHFVLFRNSKGGMKLPEPPLLLDGPYTETKELALGFYAVHPTSRQLNVEMRRLTPSSVRNSRAARGQPRPDENQEQANAGAKTEMLAQQEHTEQHCHSRIHVGDHRGA